MNQEHEIKRLQDRLDAVEKELATARKKALVAGSDADTNLEALQRMSDRRSILYRASNEINASLDSEEVYAAIYRAVEQVMPCEDFVLSLYTEENNEMVGNYVIESGKRTPVLPYRADHGLGGWVVHSRQPVLLNSGEEIKASGIRFEGYGNCPITSSVLAVPMMLKGRAVGMISAQSYQEEAYTTDDRDLLEMLASHAAIAIENARLFEQARHEIAERKVAQEHSEYLATHDALTGLPNRALFFDRLLQAIERSRRGQHDQGDNVLIAVMMIDLDNFKIINDTLGHSQGDLLLQEVAQRLSSSIRKSDTVARMGGDEFTLIFENLNNWKQAERLAGNVQDAFEKPFLLEQQEKQVTASTGVSVYCNDASDAGSLVKCADIAMYQAKQEKNKYRFYRDCN